MLAITLMFTLPGHCQVKSHLFLGWWFLRVSIKFSCRTWKNGSSRLTGGKLRTISKPLSRLQGMQAAVWQVLLWLSTQVWLPLAPSLPAALVVDSLSTLQVRGSL